MRTMGPLILGVIAGWVAFGELFIPAEGYREFYEVLRDFAQILTAAAFILGGLNVLQVNYPKIRRRDEDWQYKILMLVSAAVVGLAGIQWHDFGGTRDSGKIVEPVDATGATKGMAVIEFKTTHKEALVSVNGKIPQRAWYSEDPKDLWVPAGDKSLRVEVKPGEHEIQVLMPVAGYEVFKKKVKLNAGQLAVVETDLVMRWGAGSPEGRVFTWFYDYIFFPCNATMFALLAFFIASAAFRAFRARNVESALLLGAAILVMIGLVPIGRHISPFFPELADWIVDYPNNAGRRAIMMGAALGAIVTGLRVILGLERSHLGQEG